MCNMFQQDLGRRREGEGGEGEGRERGGVGVYGVTILKFIVDTLSKQAWG
jgi:hypothetical protein